MAPDTHTSAPRAGLRCPHCRGAVGPQAQWCTQCWADLRPPPEPEPVVVEAAPDPGVPAAGAAAPSIVEVPAPRARGARGWPCSGCGEINRVELVACAACGTAFLAGLRKDSSPVLALPVVGDLTLLSRAQRLGLAAGVVLVVMLLIALLGVLTA